MQALNEYNKNHYPNEKNAYFEEPKFFELTGDWSILMHSPPHYRAILGHGKTIEEAKDVAANLMMDVWKSWDQEADLPEPVGGNWCGTAGPVNENDAVENDPIETPTE